LRRGPCSSSAAHAVCGRSHGHRRGWARTTRFLVKEESAVPLLHG
jgi:hypothetical protein